METSEFDKHLENGSVIPAPHFIRRVLGGVPILFQFAEWLGVIAVFQYADIKFHFLTAKIVWVVLSLGFALYAGVLSTNIAWRCIKDPFRSRSLRFFMSIALPVMCGAIVFFFFKVLLPEIVSAH